MSFRSRTIDNWYKADPENKVAKKTFHIVNDSTFLVALISKSLCEVYPWMEESNPMTGGTSFSENWRIRLGRYPVIIWVTNFLQADSEKAEIFHQQIKRQNIKVKLACLPNYEDIASQVKKRTDRNLEWIWLDRENHICRLINFTETAVWAWNYNIEWSWKSLQHHLDFQAIIILYQFQNS